MIYRCRDESEVCGVNVEADTPDEAAEAFAKDQDAEGDYSFAEYGGVVEVLDGGVWKPFEITVETDLLYYANDKKVVENVVH